MADLFPNLPHPIFFKKAALNRSKSSFQNFGTDVVFVRKMKKMMKKIFTTTVYRAIATALFVIITFYKGYTTSIISATNGDWDKNNTWVGNAPGATTPDTVIIASGNKVTVSQSGKTNYSGVIIIRGELDIQGKLIMDGNSMVIIEFGGDIMAEKNGGSERLQIGSQEIRDSEINAISNPANPGEFNFITENTLLSDSGGCIEAGTCNAILPVTVVEYKAKAEEGSQIHLTWATLTEENFHYFVIERSTDLINFTAVGTIEGNGNSSQKISYQFTDRNPEPGKNYYRLKAIDYDAFTEYHGIVGAENQMIKITNSIYPNPGNGSNLKINSNMDFSSGVIMEISDSFGHVVYSTTLYQNRVNFNNQFSEGIYYVILKSNQGKTVTRWVVQ